MKLWVNALLWSLAAGILGIYLGSAVNLEGSLGIIAAIATAGAYIVRAIEEKNETK